MLNRKPIKRVMRRGPLVYAFILAISLTPLQTRAASVTLVEGDALSSEEAAHHIVLTFGPNHVVVHESSLLVDGQALTGDDVSIDALRVIRDRRPIPSRVGYESLFSYYGFQLGIAEDATALDAEAAHEPEGHKRELWVVPVTESMVVTQPPAVAPAARNPAALRAIETLSAASFESILEAVTLTFPTRYACSSAEQDAGNAIADYLESLGLLTRRIPYSGFCGSGKFSVVAIKPGTVRSDEIYVVGAHYDSTSEQPRVSAPGCNDNGSGTAAVLELARVFSQGDSEATIVFALFGGEEIGLRGSQAMVDTLEQLGLLSSVKGCVVMDMISYYDTTYGVLIEGFDGNAPQAAFLQSMASLAQTYTTLQVQTSTLPFGSDHMPFINAGLPTVLLIESDWDRYPHYHSSQDTLEHQDIDYAFEFVILCGAFLSQHAGAE